MQQMEISRIRQASRRLVRELGFMRPTLAGTDLHPSAVHAMVEIGQREAMTAADLSLILNLEKSSVSRLIRKLIDSGDVTEAASQSDGRAKLLSLTPRGRERLKEIDSFATRQVMSAIQHLDPATRAQIGKGLATYADALEGTRMEAGAAAPAITIRRGYRPGLIGACAGMHGRYYAAAAGFGARFEAKVAAGLAEFISRAERPCNGIWAAMTGGEVVGTIAIDGEDLGGGTAHLRWFIVGDGVRGTGAGRRLLNEAIAFCDRHGFARTELWTFAGLDAARHLYEAAGFTLAEARPGTQWGTEVLEQRYVRPAGTLA